MANQSRYEGGKKSLSAIHRWFRVVDIATEQQQRDVVSSSSQIMLANGVFTRPQARADLQPYRFTIEKYTYHYVSYTTFLSHLMTNPALSSIEQS